MTSVRDRPGARAWIAGLCILLAGCVSAPPSPVATNVAAMPAAAASAADASSAPIVGIAASSPDEPIAAPVPIDPLRPEVRLDIDERAARVDLWDRVRRGFGMAELDNDLVHDRERWYATRPDYVARMTERGGRYLFHIVEELDKRGMPTELALLPFIESAYNPQAMSVARASGMWQFIPSTGRDFELKQNVFRDDRRDVLASTRAALDYLQKLYGMFGDWQLALAAYNWGEGSVQRAIAKNQKAGLPTNYESLRMPAETQMYLPKLQAVKNIVARPAAFGLTLPELMNHPYFLSVPIERDMDVAIAVKLAGVPLEEFQYLNPQMNRPVILAAGTPQVLLPYDAANLFVRELPRHRGPLATWTAWTAPSTMTTASAAKAVGMPEDQLRDVNRIPARMLIKAGSTLLVPRGSAMAVDVPVHVADNAMLALVSDAPAQRRVTLRAGRKETVATVAKRYRVSPAQVAEWNKVGVGASFAPGHQVVIYQAAGRKAAPQVAAAPAQSLRAKANTSRSTQKVAATKSASKPAAKPAVRTASPRSTPPATKPTRTAKAAPAARSPRNSGAGN